MVGGGGSGGGRHGGGGGAGGFLKGSLTLAASTLSVTIGAGGAPVYGTEVVGKDGGSTVAFGATALGGGGGGTHGSTNGRAGGSGGGGGHGPTIGGGKQQGDSGGLTGFGYPGGDSTNGGNEGSGGGGAMVAIAEEHTKENIIQAFKTAGAHDAYEVKLAIH